MAPLTAAADLVIGAGGSSTWERCVLGTPTLQVVLADNQADAAHRLEALGAVVRLDGRSELFEAELMLGFKALVRDAAARTRLSAVSAGLCDGRGAERAADVLTARLESGARSIH
jgi:spore coat polysaccharide biosynthesis predicted glycosyltransferase SpsG